MKNCSFSDNLIHNFHEELLKTVFLSELSAKKKFPANFLNSTRAFLNNRSQLIHEHTPSKKSNDKNRRQFSNLSSHLQIQKLFKLDQNFTPIFRFFELSDFLSTLQPMNIL